MIEFFFWIFILLKLKNIQIIYVDTWLLGRYILKVKFRIGYGHFPLTNHDVAQTSPQISACFPKKHNLTNRQITNVFPTHHVQIEWTIPGGMWFLKQVKIVLFNTNAQVSARHAQIRPKIHHKPTKTWIRRFNNKWAIIIGFRTLERIIETIL